MAGFQQGLIATGLIGFMATPALAGSILEIQYDTSSFENVVLSDGDVSVSIDYISSETLNLDDNNLIYELLYQGESRQQVQTSTAVFAQFQIGDLDNDDVPEVIVQNFSGGAHCCTNNIIYRWQAADQTFSAVETGYLDGAGVEFRDLDSDGFTELMGYDNAFLYRFGSYADSYPPHTIYTYRAGELVNTTRNYPELLEARANEMRTAFLEAQARGYTSNSLLAGYVAESILAGDYETAWQFMLANYNREEDWGLSILNDDGEVVDKYPDFPSALKIFLVETGYLDAAGMPI